jgi:Tfp pilus assembly protein PilO
VKLQSLKLDFVKRPRTLITIAGVLVLLLGWWFFWMTPQSAKLTTVDTQISTLQSKYQGLQITLKTDESQSAKESLYAGYLKMFAQAVPEVPDAGGLTTDLAALADSISPNLSILSITDDTTVAGTPLGMVPLTLSIKGPRNDCFTFLDDLYNQSKFPRLITVSAFTPTASSGVSAILKNGTEPYNLSLTGDAYYDANIDPALGTPPTTTTLPA